MSDINERRGVPEGWDRSGLAPWTYLNDELAELEKDTLFRRHWQLACHVSNLPERGSYITFDIVGERAIVMIGHCGARQAQILPAHFAEATLAARQDDVHHDAIADRDVSVGSGFHN